MPFLLKNLAEEKIVATFQTFLKWYWIANRRRYHTENSLTDVVKHGQRSVSYDRRNFLDDNVVFCFLIFYRMVQYLTNYMPEQKTSWRIVKIHALSHYADDIRRGGITSEYSAEMWESLHKNLMKRPYRGSNKKNTSDQILTKHAQQWSINQLKNEVENISQSVDEEEELRDEMHNILPQSKKILNLIALTKEGEPHAGKWARFQSAVQVYLKIYYPEGIEYPQKVCRWII